MALVTVTFEWDDRYGPCIDCGLPAAYETPDFPSSGPPARYCCRCAALAAAYSGERIVHLFAEDD